MYENRAQPPLSRTGFFKRFVQHLLAASFLLVFSLGVGVWGYMLFEHLPFVDAFLNAAMLIGGMGPVNAPATVLGKIFAGAYALYAGLLFVVSSALILTPVVHRAFHRFHWDDKL